MKIEPDSGALVQLIVIFEPPVVDHDPNWISSGERTVYGARPIIDRAMWSDPQSMQFERESPLFVTIDDLALAMDPDHFRVIFSNRTPASTLVCGDVHVDLSEDGVLVAIGSRRPAV